MKQFDFKKSLGQNFLHDQNVIHKIVDSADIDRDSLVIEVGPGGGALTNFIVPLCGQALLYEADRRLESSLHQLLHQYSNYEVILGDFLKADLSNDLKKYFYDKLCVVANLPYYITTPIIMKFIDENIFPDQMVIMVQKEVAYRLSAKVGTKDYGSLTVFLNYYYDIQKLFDVSRNCFTPKPNVDSAVIRMNLKKERLKVHNMDLFKRLVRDCFLYKRKTLRNNLKGYNLEIVASVLSKYGLDLNVRAENLKLEVFVAIANELASDS